MGSLTNLTENDFLALFFQNVGVAGIGDATGIRPSSANGTWTFVALQSWPGETGDLTSEVTFTGKLRPTVNRDTSSWNTPVNGTISPVAPIYFGLRTDAGAQQDIAYFACLDNSSNVRIWGALGDASFGSRPFVCNSSASDTVMIPGHGLAAGDQIAFFEAEGPSSLPGGMVEGTVYFVRTSGLTTDEITLSTTGAGGSVVNLTSLGSGAAVKILPLHVTQNVNPGLQNSALIRLT